MSNGRTSPLRAVVRLGATALALTLAAPAPGAAAGTRFVALGHIRDLTPSHADLLRDLADAINGTSPDHVFLLGDLTFDGSPEQWAPIDRFLADLHAPAYGAPGNHEIQHDRRGFLARFGTLYRTVQAPDATFLLINSCDDVATIAAYIRAATDRPRAPGPVVLLSHYRLWEPREEERSAHRRGWPGYRERLWAAGIDVTFDQWVAEFTKSFSWEELLPALRGRVDVVLAGDGSAPPYAAAFRDGIALHGVGMGGAGGAISFFVGEIGDGGDVVLEERRVAVAPGHLWHAQPGDSLETFLARRRRQAPRDAGFLPLVLSTTTILALFGLARRTFG